MLNHTQQHNEEFTNERHSVQDTMHLQELIKLLVTRGDMRSVSFLGDIILDIQATHKLNHQEALKMIERQVFHELQGRIRGMAHMYGVA